MAFDDFVIIEVDLGENSQAADYSSNRVPVHFDKIPRLCRDLLLMKFWTSQDRSLLLH